MQLGNAAWGLRETPLEQQLAITAAMGLDLLELSIAGYDREKGTVSIIFTSMRMRGRSPKLRTSSADTTSGWNAPAPGTISPATTRRSS